MPSEKTTGIGIKFKKNIDYKYNYKTKNIQNCTFILHERWCCFAEPN